MPPIIESAGDLLARYNVLFCDIWGVVHNGRTAYRDGCAALAEFRARGGTVILVSNAPRTPLSVTRVLDEKGVPDTSWDAIVSSGGIALEHAHEKDYRTVHHIGPDRDLDIFDESHLERVAIEEADAILCTGLIHDRHETGEDYRARLAEPARRKLPLVCANPDLIVDVGGTMLPCAGAIAVVYEDLGGPVYWAGKPHGTAYASALAKAEELRGERVGKSEILAIGDAVRTDVAGADAFGVEALFIAQGIHRDELLDGETILPERLGEVFAGNAPQAVAAMTTLRW